ncbi:MAG: L-seryl-tRNA(Sec) selenium transferase [Candidatus Dormibacterales bacterium]
MHRLLRPLALPGVGRLVNEPRYARLRELYPHALLVDAIREQLGRERGAAPASDEERALRVEALLRSWSQPGLRRVINATGVVLHTNLGRAPLSEEAAEAAARVARGYTNLEVDLATGRRGERAPQVAALLRRLTGAEAALAVNNNAAAVLLALTALCRGREVIVSRGQLVEIGGSFRMPDVMRVSGARMVEVGTTNRTRAEDYEAALSGRTAAILKVHTSNFRVTGFTESAPLAALSELARRRSLLLIDDVGSGALEEVLGEPSVKASVELSDVVLFSGDKLVGGPQAGIALGRSAPLRKMARHPLARALRADKMTLAALEATLLQRLLGRHAAPVARMLSLQPAELRRRAAWWSVRLADRGVPTRLLEAESAAGGGSLPGRGLATVLLAVEGPASRLTSALRLGEPAVLARIEGRLCCLDPRTVLRGEDEALVDAVEVAHEAAATPREAAARAAASRACTTSSAPPGTSTTASPRSSRP